MKKFLLTLLALTATLAIAPIAVADTVNFHAISSDHSISTNQIITLGSETSVTGVYNIASISGTFSNSDLGISNAAITGMVANYGVLSPQCVGSICGDVYTSSDGKWWYDNLVFLPGNSAGNTLLFDYMGGDFFTVESGGNTYEVNISTDNGSYHIWASKSDSYVINGREGEPLSEAPEPGSLLLLGTGLLGLAAILFRKTKPSGLVMHS
jgi:hypothetical protein